MIDTMARVAESNRIDEIRAWKRKRVIEMDVDEVARSHFVCYLRVPLSNFRSFGKR